MHNLLPLEEVEEVFAAGLHPEQRRLALRPSDGLRVESALRRRDPQRLAAEVLLTADLVLEGEALTLEQLRVLFESCRGAATELRVCADGSVPAPAPASMMMPNP